MGPVEQELSRNVVPLQPFAPSGPGREHIIFRLVIICLLCCCKPFQIFFLLRSKQVNFALYNLQSSQMLSSVTFQRNTTDSFRDAGHHQGMATCTQIQDQTTWWDMMTDEASQQILWLLARVDRPTIFRIDPYPICHIRKGPNILSHQHGSFTRGREIPIPFAFPFPPCQDEVLRGVQITFPMSFRVYLPPGNHTRLHPSRSLDGFEDDGKVLPSCKTNKQTAIVAVDGLQGRQKNMKLGLIPGFIYPINLL